jgi:hypothetical protein
MATVEKNLKDMTIEYVKSRVEEGGIYVDQLFFHDPDGTMIEICNCDNLPVIPLTADDTGRSSCSLVHCNVQQQQQQQQIQQIIQMAPQQRLTCLPSLHLTEDYLHCA